MSSFVNIDPSYKNPYLSRSEDFLEVKIEEIDVPAISVIEESSVIAVPEMPVPVIEEPEVFERNITVPINPSLRRRISAIHRNLEVTTTNTRRNLGSHTVLTIRGTNQTEVDNAVDNIRSDMIRSIRRGRTETSRTIQQQMRQAILR